MYYMYASSSTVSGRLSGGCTLYSRVNKACLCRRVQNSYCANGPIKLWKDPALGPIRRFWGGRWELPWKAWQMTLFLPRSSSCRNQLVNSLKLRPTLKPKLSCFTFEQTIPLFLFHITSLVEKFFALSDHIPIPLITSPTKQPQSCTAHIP